MKVVLVTGGFDPLHSGHISYFKAAKQLGDTLIVGLNSDKWLARKKGQAFMPWSERAVIIENLTMVNKVISFNDDDDSAIDAIRVVRILYPSCKVIFANGGDRTLDNIREMSESDVIFEFGVGGEEKLNSSSQILKSWTPSKTNRPWGSYRILYDEVGTKVKELIINPCRKLSMQKHKLRSEYWFVVKGSCIVETEHSAMQVHAHDEKVKIPVDTWHRLGNPFDEPCHIIEIQYGANCIEEDIERRS